jgi:hypothetical protein
MAAFAKEPTVPNPITDRLSAASAWLTRRSRGLAGLYHPRTWRDRGLVWTAGLLSLTLVVFLLILSFMWSREPAAFDPYGEALARAGGDAELIVTGYVTTATLIEASSTLLDKPGGYLSNDVMPPGVWLDNIPNWEFGVLVQVRDLARALRNDFARSQSQSAEDPDLMIAEPQFNFDNSSWMFPPSESEYREAIRALERYLARLSDPEQPDAQFFARADNLRAWLEIVEKRLGSLSQRLSASVGQVRVNTDLAGDAGARQATARPADIVVKTPWLEIDDVFFEARGAAWALMHFVQALEHDFRDVLEKKNAVVSLRQIERELRATQEPIWSPVILNGSGFGFVNNHSLVMASYLSRANAAVIDLRNLLEQG